MVRLFALLAFALALFPCQAADVVAPQVADVAVQRLPDQQNIRFTLITPRGYVGFTAVKNWTVIAMQSHPPITVTAFQIPDAADAQTEDSTNLAVSLFLPESDKAQQALSADKKKHGDVGAITEHYKEWTVYRWQANQGQTPYTILDAQASKADMICGVRLAWPHLAAHDSDYDRKLEDIFKSVLESVSGEIGVYQIHQDEIVRRPNN